MENTTAVLLAGLGAALISAVAMLIQSWLNNRHAVKRLKEEKKADRQLKLMEASMGQIQELLSVFHEFHQSLSELTSPYQDTDHDARKKRAEAFLDIWKKTRVLTQKSRLFLPLGTYKRADEILDQLVNLAAKFEASMAALEHRLTSNPDCSWETVNNRVIKEVPILIDDLHRLFRCVLDLDE